MTRMVLTSAASFMALMGFDVILAVNVIVSDLVSDVIIVNNNVARGKF